MAALATEAQVRFITSLRTERGLEAGSEVARLTKREASAEIERLKAMPRPRKAYAPEPDAPAPGYYAAEYKGVLRFYRVVAGKGKWEGRTFLNRFRSDLEDRVFAAERAAAYAEINADPVAAAMRFARETVHCYRCGRRLTDEESRARGMGKDCAAM